MKYIIISIWLPIFFLCSVDVFGIASQSIFTTDQISVSQGSAYIKKVRSRNPILSGVLTDSTKRILTCLTMQTLSAF